MSQSPLLNYAITTSPDPLQVGNTGSVTVVASNPGYYSDTAAQNYVEVNKIVIDFGAPGQGGSALSNDPAKISITAPDGWSGPAVSGLQYSFTAPTAANANRIFPNAGLNFVFSTIEINATVGSVTTSIGETASAPGGTNPAIYPPYTKMLRNLDVPIGKFPANFAISSFAASQATVAPGASVQLAWNATEMAHESFSLTYPVNGTVVTIDRHGDGTAFEPVDTYPNPQHDGNLRLSIAGTTIFTLNVSYVENTNTVQAQSQTSVSVPDPIIQSFAAKPATGLSVGDKITLSWSTLAADSVAIDPPLDGLNSGVEKSGSADVFPVTFTRYLLTASGRGLNVRQSLVVFPLVPGWSEVTNAATWRSEEYPVFFACGEFLWMYPGLAGSWKNPAYSSPDGKSWLLINPNASLPARHGGGVISNGQGDILVMGGEGQNGFGNDVWKTSDGKTWTEVTAKAGWSARRGAGCVWYNGNYWIMGGSDSTGKPLGDVWSSPDGNSWTKKTDTPGWSPRSDFGLTVFNSKLYLFGGMASGQYNMDLWSSSDGISWQNLTNPFGPSTSPSARSNPLMFASGNTMMLIGGKKSGGGAINDAYTLDISNDWAAGNTPPLPMDDTSFGVSDFNGGTWIAGGVLGPVSGRSVWVFAPG